MAENKKLRQLRCWASVEHKNIFYHCRISVLVSFLRLRALFLHFRCRIPSSEVPLSVVTCGPEPCHAARESTLPEYASRSPECLSTPQVPAWPAAVVTTCSFPLVCHHKWPLVSLRRGSSQPLMVAAAAAADSAVFPLLPFF